MLWSSFFVFQTQQTILSYKAIAFVLCVEIGLQAPDDSSSLSIQSIE